MREFQKTEPSPLLRKQMTAEVRAFGGPPSAPSAPNGPAGRTYERAMVEGGEAGSTIYSTHGIIVTPPPPLPHPAARLDAPAGGKKNTGLIKCQNTNTTIFFRGTKF